MYGHRPEYKRMMMMMMMMMMMTRIVSSEFTCHNNTCSDNEYFSEDGSCIDCPSGKTSEAGAILCTRCDVMYMFSTHCTFPVLGIIILGVLLTAAFVSSPFDVFDI